MVFTQLKLTFSCTFASSSATGWQNQRVVTGTFLFWQCKRKPACSGGVVSGGGQMDEAETSPAPPLSNVATEDHHGDQWSAPV